MPSILFHLLIFLGATSAVVSQFQGPIGVCNGRHGNNLPPEQDVVELYKATGIMKMRIYDPNQATLTALQNSGIDLILDVPIADLPSLQSSAATWIHTNVAPYFPATKIRYIAVGNEIVDSATAALLLPAMQNIYTALSDLGLENQIKVSTATFSGALENTSPPSSSAFKYAAVMAPIVEFLVKTESPLLVNIYPYFAYAGDRRINLDFALFTSQTVEFADNGEYRNLFDAMVDGVYYALEKDGASTEQHFGLFYPVDKTPKYQLN